MSVRSESLSKSDASVVAREAPAASAGWIGSGSSSGAGHSATGSGSYRLVIVTQRIRIHTKILTTPNVSIDTLMHNMREVYATAAIDVEWASTQNLNLPALNDLDKGNLKYHTDFRRVYATIIDKWLLTPGAHTGILNDTFTTLGFLT